MSDVPENAPEACPGTQSDSAGKTSACQGCPNQNICASGVNQGPDPDIEKIKANLLPVHHKLLIFSGKGGVGKSTFSVTLARALAQDEQKQVALLDVDICGPSVPKMTGLEGEQIHQSGSGWSPVFMGDNLCIMSVGFLLGGPDDAVIWRGPRKNGMIKQFLRDVDWGDSEFLVIDTPPGTSDEHLSLVSYLGTTDTSVVIVTTPQEVALLDVRKEINFCRRVGLDVIGVVENMSTFVCPKCKTESEIFMASTGGAEKMCAELGVDLLGRIPLDPRVARCLDEGRNLFESDSPAVQAYNSIAQRITEKVLLKKNMIS